MKILVISDTHGHGAHLLRQVVETEGKPDYCLHLGDFGDEIDTLSEIVGSEIIKIRGNCDWDRSLSLAAIVELGGHKIFMAHGFTYNVDWSLDFLEQAARENGADIAIYGHLHIPYLEEKEDGFLILNPGSLGRSRTQDEYEYYAVMEIDDQSQKVTIRHERI